MLKRLFAAALAAVFAVAALPRDARAEDTKLTIMVFQGLQNLPLLVAQSKGFFAKRGLSVDIKIAPNSDELRNGLAEGRYQIVHTAVDNALGHGRRRQQGHRCRYRRRQQLQPSDRAA